MVLGRKLCQWLLKVNLALGAILIFWSNPQTTLAAEKITFTYGLASQSVSLEELEVFAATGEISPALSFLLNISGTNPDVVRWLLTQEFPSHTVITSKLLNSVIGKYVLTQSTNVVHSGSPRGDVKAIRGALIISGSDDNRVSLLELWRNYPTKEVYVDAKSLLKVSRLRRYTFF